MLRVGRLRFYLFSREEPRVHVHVEGPAGEARLWLEPAVEVAQNWGIPERDQRIALKAAEEHIDAIRNAWNEQFGR